MRFITNRRLTNWISLSMVLFLPLSLRVPFASPRSAQTSPKEEKEDNPYSVALFASLAEMQKEYGKQRDAIDYRHASVEKDSEITNDIPTERGDYHVEVLDRQAQIEKYKASRKKFPILEIHPAKLAGPKLTINVSVSYVSLKGAKVMRAISDWSDVEFRYDCQQQRYVVSSVNLGGI